MKRCVSLCLACIVFVTLLSNRAFSLNSPYTPPVSPQESLSVGDRYVVEKNMAIAKKLQSLKVPKPKLKQYLMGNRNMAIVSPATEEVF